MHPFNLQLHPYKRGMLYFTRANIAPKIRTSYLPPYPYYILFFPTLVYEFAHQQYFRKFAHHNQIPTPAEKYTITSYFKQITKIVEQQSESVKCPTANPAHKSN